jgi:GTP cyclohydrolase II
MNHTSFRSDPLLAREVNRAVGDMRRGVAVVITSDRGRRYLALAAETASDATLQEFLAAARDEPILMLALSRAADLDVTFAAGATTTTQNESAAVLVPLTPAQLNVASLRAMADPTAVQPRIGHPTASSVAEHLSEPAMMLAKLARLLPAVLVAHATSETPGLLEVSAAAIRAYPAHVAQGLEPAAEARVPLDEAEDVRIVAFRPPDGGIEHLAILIGDPETAETPLVRVHSECFTGDLLGSRRCDCGPQLHQAIRRMEAEGAGVILYMAQEGRGIGLVNKLRAYKLQDEGLDTLDANRALGYGADERSFAAAAAMLTRLGITRIRLLTNNPAKIAGLAAHGIEVAGRVSHAIAANGENDSYLATKALRFGHLLG